MNEDDFRRIVREELRRDRIGPRCPKCHESGGIVESMMELEGYISENEDIESDLDKYVFNCGTCEFSGYPKDFDPANQSSSP